MWKAEKIDLIKNEHYSTSQLYFDGWYTLKINGEIIKVNIENPKEYFNLCFQSVVCNFCGEEGCNVGGMLTIRKKGDSLLFLPVFDDMEDWKEYDSSNSEGDSNCPPHKWFTDGILVVEGEPLKLLLELVSGIANSNIPEVDTSELEQIEKWENLVKKAKRLN